MEISPVSSSRAKQSRQTCLSLFRYLPFTLNPSRSFCQPNFELSSAAHSISTTRGRIDIGWSESCCSPPTCFPVSRTKRREEIENSIDEAGIDRRRSVARKSATRGTFRRGYEERVLVPFLSFSWRRIVREDIRSPQRGGTPVGVINSSRLEISFRRAAQRRPSPFPLLSQGGVGKFLRVFKS